MWWSNFWNGLNIRKALALIVVISGVGLVAYLRTESLVTSLLTTMASIIGYYFGYENGQKQVNAQ